MARQARESNTALDLPPWRSTLALAATVFVGGCFSDTTGNGGPDDKPGDTSAGSSSTSLDGDDETSAVTPGLDDGADSTTLASSEDTSDTPQCPTNSECLPLAPPMWSGPRQVFAAPAGAMPVPPCPSGDPPLRAGGVPPLLAGPANCECQPGEPECGTTLVTIDSTASDCAIQTELQVLSVGGTQCAQIGLQSAFVGLLNGNEPAECPAAGVMTDTPPAVWTERHGVCDVPNPMNCDGGTCGPPSDGPGRMCVVRDGIHDCPAGAYTDRVIVFDGIEDDRQCTECVTEADCGQVEYYADLGCQGSPFLSWPATDNSDETLCTPLPVRDDIEHESVQWSGPVACRVIEDTQPMGQAVPIEPFTMCCLAEG
ncbi:MAG: hypothetical protein JKY37_01835 [Nannocystaceae bacterium]|nr:hypothetical protein [Nannocystaceae bacterium]